MRNPIGFSLVVLYASGLDEKHFRGGLPGRHHREDVFLPGHRKIHDYQVVSGQGLLDYRYHLTFLGSPQADCAVGLGQLDKIGVTSMTVPE